MTYTSNSEEKQMDGCSAVVSSDPPSRYYLYRRVEVSFSQNCEAATVMNWSMNINNPLFKLFCRLNGLWPSRGGRIYM